MSLTGIRDVDMNIILQLEDRELPRVCAVNKYVNEICESDAFWYRRLINRITKVRDDNFLKYKQLKIKDVTGERIREMQRFFGLKSLKELNIYLNELPPNAVYLAYHGFPFVDQEIEEMYKFNEADLPKYINRDELRFEMRREVSKVAYFAKYDRTIRDPDFIFNFTLRPVRSISKLGQKFYDAYKTMGIFK